MQPMIARPSVASLPLEPRARGAVLGTATCFVVQHEDRSYAITNWHVVTGRRPDNGALLSLTGAVPDELGIVHNKADALGSWVSKTEKLYGDDGNPLWLDHPRYGRNVDMVALELTDLDGVALYPHDPWNVGPGLAVVVAGDVSIIGFPFGLAAGGALGIWVRGAIASEPSLHYDDRPCFLVDSRTRPGQSGSPVIVYSAGGAVPMADGGTSIFGGPVEQFLGVYSGRINDQSDLGFVWKSSALVEIVEGGHKGSI